MPRISLAHSIARLIHLKFLIIHHLGFDSTLMRILLSFQRLRRLDIRINTVISNKNELCQNLENCGNLEEFNV
jgi:hypothetical protein